MIVNMFYGNKSKYFFRMATKKYMRDMKNNNHRKKYNSFLNKGQM